MESPANRVPTLAELLEGGVHLEVACCRHRCRRRERWPAAVAITRLGSDSTVLDARRRLKCQACGARTPEIDVRPCSIDHSVLRQRERHAREIHELGQATFDLEAALTLSRRLAGGPVAGDPE